MDASMRFLSSKEAAEYIGISEDELLEMADKRKVASYKIGGIYTRFRVDDLDAYLRKVPKSLKRKSAETASDRIKDFFYFNDFYILFVIAIAVILYFIFR